MYYIRKRQFDTWAHWTHRHIWNLLRLLGVFQSRFKQKNFLGLTEWSEKELERIVPESKDYT